MIFLTYLTFRSIEFLNVYYSQIINRFSQKCKKKKVATDFISELKRVESYLDFEKNGSVRSIGVYN